MFKTLATSLLALTLATTAQADEVWDSLNGEIIYLADEYGSAVLSLNFSDGTPAELVIPNLAGNSQDRGVHRVYYIAHGDLQCDSALARPGQLASLDWGQGFISFDYPEFPTSFTLTLGDCFDAPYFSIRGEAR